MKRRGLRLAVQIFTISFLLAAALFVLGPVRTTLEQRLDGFRDEAIGQLESILGRRISYASISPSILRFLSIRELTIHGREGEPADLLSVERLRVFYRPLMLLRGEFTDAFSEIRIENTALRIDTATDADLGLLATDVLERRRQELAAERGSDAGEIQLSEILPEDIVISGQNIQLTLRSTFGLVEMDNLTFAASLTDGTVDVGASGNARLSETDPQFPFRNVVGRIEADGTVNASTGDSILEVALPTLRSDLFTIRSQVLQVRLGPGRIEARNVQNRDPIDLYLRVAPAENAIYGRILADRYELTRLVQLDGDLSEFNEFLAIPVSGQASATLTPDSLQFGGSLLTSIPEFRGIPGGEVTAQFDGDTRSVSIDRLSLLTGEGSFSYSGELGLSPLRPNGDLRISNVTYGGIAPLTARARLESTTDTLSVQASRFIYGGSLIRSLTGTIDLSGLPVGTLAAELGPNGESRLQVTTLHEDGGRIRSATVAGRQVEPARLVRIAESAFPTLEIPDLSFLPPGMLVDTRFGIELSDGFALDVPFLHVSDPATEDTVRLGLYYENGSLDITNARASYGGFDGSGNFSATLGRNRAISFHSDIKVEGIPYEFTGSFEPDNSLLIRGLYDVKARLFFGERGELVFDASGDLPLPIGQENFSYLSFAADGHFFSMEDWGVNLDQFTASGVPIAMIPSTDVAVRGRLSPTGASLSRVEYRDEYSSLAGTATVAWDLAETTLQASIDLGAETEEAEATGSERYSVDFAYTPDSLDAEIQATSFPLLRVGVETVRGAVDAGVSITGTLEEPTITGSGSLVDGKFNNDPVEIEAEIVVAPDRLEIVSGRGKLVRVEARDLAGAVDLVTGELSLGGTWIQGREEPLTVGVLATGRFDGRQSLTSLPQSDFSAQVTLDGIPVQEGFSPIWTFAVTREQGTFEARGAPGDALFVRLDDSGEFEGSSLAPLPLEFDAVGVLDGGDIEVDFINVNGEIARLWGMLDARGFALTGGTFSGSARIVGPVNDPDFYGTLVAEAVTAELDVLDEQLGPVRSFVVFDEKQMTVREASVTAGSGSASVSMIALFSRWIPEEYQIRVRTDEGAPIPIRNEFGDIAMDGMAAGSVLIAGDRGGIDITGDLVASPMSITLSDTEEIELPDEAANELTVDLNVSTARGVEFLWPTATFPILRGSADVGEQVRITYQEDPREYSVDGDVEIQSGEIFYFDRSFYIREGAMRFAEDQNGFDPLLTVNAEIREVGDEGPVRIYLVADERPLSEFTPQWRSDPPLSEAAILTLLGGNVFITDTGEPIDLSDAVLLGTDVASQFGIIRGFESSVRETLQLDLFSIRTQLFQNLLRGVIDQNQELPLDTGAPSLGQYLDNTTLFMGKYLGTDLFLELLVQLSATNQSDVTAQSLTGIEIDSEFALELQTPFFLLEWSFFPRDPSTLFLSDNTISFSWDYTY